MNDYYVIDSNMFFDYMNNKVKKITVKDKNGNIYKVNEKYIYSIKQVEDINTEIEKLQEGR